MFVGPKVVAPVLQRCIDAGVLPQPSGGTFTVSWPRIQSLALNERADAARNMTAAINQYLSSGMSEVIPFGAYLVYTCGYTESEALDIEAKSDIKKWKTVLKSTQSAGSSASPAVPDKNAKTTSASAELEARITEVESKLAETPLNEILHNERALAEGLSSLERKGRVKAGSGG